MDNQKHGIGKQMYAKVGEYYGYWENGNMGGATKEMKKDGEVSASQLEGRGLPQSTLRKGSSRGYAGCRENLARTPRWSTKHWPQSFQPTPSTQSRL